MRICTAIITVCLIATGAYALDEDTKGQMIDIYNITATQYSLLVRTIDDLSNEKITKETATNKIEGWKAEYDKRVEPVPQEAKKMCSLMHAMIDSARNAARDYDPHNVRTKDALKKYEEAKSDLDKEMTEVKYAIQ